MNPGKNFGLSISSPLDNCFFFRWTKLSYCKLTSALEKSQPLPEHFLTFLQGVLIGDKLFLSVRQSLTEVGGFFQYDNFGRPISGFQVGNQWTEEFESVTEIHSPLTLHRVVLGAFFAAVFGIAGSPGATFPRRTGTAFAGRPRSFTAAPFAAAATTTVLSAQLHFARFLQRRLVRMFALLSCRCDCKLQLLSHQRRRMRWKSFAHQHLSGSRRVNSGRCNCKEGKNSWVYFKPRQGRSVAKIGNKLTAQSVKSV